MRADHDVRIGGIGPFGNPAPFAVHLHQCRDHAADAFRGHEQQPGMLCPEGVPKRVGVVRHAVVDPVVEGTVITPVFRELPGVLQRAEESGVEDVHILLRSSFERGFFQGPGPGVAHPVAGVGERSALRNFAVEVGRGLCVVDERRSDADFHQFGSRSEFDITSCRRTARARAAFVHARAVPRAVGRERL